ncbi:MAG: lytic transglycosylase domain-containing protein [Candidatus Pacearchaeota archaeon]|nr:lytic transglycosylase domain-containing protein [Candidatus Pacearchaeota archaeon]
MRKKLILTVAVLTRLLVTQEAGAPSQSAFQARFFPKPNLERIAIDFFGEKYVKEKEEFEKILKKTREERKDALLSDIDKIYGFIYNVYKNQEIQIPDYITKKFIRNVIRIESSDYSKAVGTEGERGYMQIMKSTWYEVEKQDFKKNAFIPEKNIGAGIKYMLLIDNYCRKNHPKWEELNDWEKLKIITASYNGGKAKLKKMNWDISKMKKRTRNYIIKLDNLYNNPKIIQ